ncbi:hypothetical protein EDC01DRAFT_13250 [Geopyxis carbonaria]|nr:hypothetical protein EDC01DRAFT_13250 [Geopyxis carbonaria]
MPLEVIDLTRESPSPPQRRRQRRPIVIDLDDGDEPEVVARGSGDEVQFVSEQRLPGAPLFWPPQYPPPVRPNRPFHQAHHALSIEPPLLPPSQPAYRHWHQHFFDEARRMMIEQPRGFRPPDLNYGRVSPVAEGVNADYKEPPPAKPGYTHSPEEGDILICAECEHELGTESGKAGGSLVWSGKCGHVRSCFYVNYIHG